jgi:hypothetical protein
MPEEDLHLSIYLRFTRTIRRLPSAALPVFNRRRGCRLKVKISPDSVGGFPTAWW